MCATMREKLSRQMFEVVIQAAANGKIIARETLKVCLQQTLFPIPALHENGHIGDGIVILCQNPYCGRRYHADMVTCVCPVYRPSGRMCWQSAMVEMCPGMHVSITALICRVQVPWACLV